MRLFRHCECSKSPDGTGMEITTKVLFCSFKAPLCPAIERFLYQDFMVVILNIVLNTLLIIKKITMKKTAIIITAFAMMFAASCSKTEVQQPAGATNNVM